MRDLTEIFSEAYSGETRRRSRFGMDHTGDDFDPRNNPYNDGRDLDDVEWDDEDIPTEDPNEEREITRRRQVSLDAALRQARADEMEDEDDVDPRAEHFEDEDEQEAEDEEEAIGFGKAGVRDSRRGARQEDEDEAEDETEDEADSRRGADQSRVRKLKCAKCGEATRVTPPKGYRFRSRTDEDEAGGEKGKQVKWACPWCAKWSTATVVGDQARSVRRGATYGDEGTYRADASESAARAISVFRESYRKEPTPPHPAASAIDSFHLMYEGSLDRALWNRAKAQHAR